MGLSAPLALLGLLLALVPVVAHLLRRADVRVRTLPTLELLRRAAVESRRRVRVVDPWLLVLRVLLVGLAALALAGPFFRDELSYGDGRIASVVVVVDDSMSMEVLDGSRTRFESALVRALEIAEALPTGSELAIVRGGRRPRVLLSRTTDVATARAILTTQPPLSGTARGSDLPAAIDLAARQLAGARHVLRRIVLLSDFAGPAAGTELTAPDGMSLDAERIGGDAAPLNVGFTRVALDPDSASGLRLTVEARAFGDDAPSSVPMRVVWRGVELETADLTFERGVARTVLVIEPPGGPDELDAEPFLTVSMTTADALRVDDTRAVLLRAPSAPRVLVVDGRPGSLARRAPGEEDGARFVRDALALVPREGGGPFVTRIVDGAGLLSVPVGSVDVLVLAGVDLSSENIADAVRAHVSGGAGVLLTAGPHAAAGSEGRMSDLLPAHMSAVVDGAIEGLERAPGTSVLPPGATGLEHVRATRRTTLEPGDPGDVVLRFADGAAALVVSSERRSAMLGLPLDASTSDLPYRPGFLPLLSRVLGALARPGAMPDEPVSPGDVPALALSNGRDIEVALPSGGLWTREVEHGRVVFEDLDLAGAYVLRLPRPDGTLAPSPRSAFVLAAPIEESDLSVGALPTAGPAADASLEARAVVERPYGPWAFLAVGLFAVVEGLARSRRLPRSVPAAASRA